MLIIYKMLCLLADIILFKSSGKIIFKEGIKHFQGNYRYSACLLLITLFPALFNE